MKKFLMAAVAAIVLASAIAILVYNLNYEPLPPGSVADRVLLEKSERRLTIFKNSVALKTYSVSLGWQPVGTKQFEGDGKTPEGPYIIDWRKEDSGFHLALHISYPDLKDVKYAESKKKSPGGAIMIHGLRNGLGFLGPLHRLYDWTQGCIAVTNAEIEELWRAVPDGTPIEIQP